MRALLPLLVLCTGLACRVHPLPPSEPPAPAGPPPAAPTPPPDAGPPAAPVRPVTLVVGGDVTLGFHFEEYFDEQVSKGRSREELLAHGFKAVLPAVRGAELFLVNLECPFTDRGEKLPKNFNFRARPELVGSLVGAGVGAVSLANNHMMDFGSIGLTDTLATLDQVKIPHFGAGGSLGEARKALVLERGGIRFALLGYFFLGDRNIEPKEVIATDGTPGVAGHHEDEAIMERMLREDIAVARSQADLVIPFFHWGKEGEHSPQGYQQRLAHAAVEAGAAAVLGSHPHVLQGMELYRGVPVLYSLGNFVFGGNWNPKDKESALVRLRFTPGGYLDSEVIPLQTDRYPEIPIQPFPLEGDAAARVMQHLVDYSSELDQMLPPLAAWKVGRAGKP